MVCRQVSGRLRLKMQAAYTDLPMCSGSQRLLPQLPQHLMKLDQGDAAIGHQRHSKGHEMNFLGAGPACEDALHIQSERTVVALVALNINLESDVLLLATGT